MKYVLLIIMLIFASCWMQPHRWHSDGTYQHKMVNVGIDKKFYYYRCIKKGCSYTMRERRLNQ